MSEHLAALTCWACCEAHVVASRHLRSLTAVCPLTRPRLLPARSLYLAAADDPVMLGLLRDAQQQSDILRQRLVNAEAHAVALLQVHGVCAGTLRTKP